MTELTDFLLARITDDEELALAQAGWGVERYGETPTTFEMQINSNSWLQVSPTRVLAECYVKRSIVQSDFTMGGRDGDWDSGFDYGAERAQEQILRLLALPYADHPDYREAWRP